MPALYHPESLPIALLNGCVRSNGDLFIAGLHRKGHHVEDLVMTLRPGAKTYRIYICFHFQQYQEVQCRSILF